MLASPRSSGRQGFSVAKTSGFTLIELLTVIAIIMILAAIVVGVQRGVYSSQANAKARAEMSVIATALEQYKATYGTYPVLSVTNASSAQDFYLHMIGKRWAEPKANKLNDFKSGTRKAFIDVGQMTLKNKNTPDATYFVDPWGEPYYYRYDNNPNGDYGEHFFILYSKGPDKKGGHTDITRYASAQAYFTDDDYADDIVYGLENN